MRARGHTAVLAVVSALVAGTTAPASADICVAVTVLVDRESQLPVHGHCEPYSAVVFCFGPDVEIDPTVAVFTNVCLPWI